MSDIAQRPSGAHVANPESRRRVPKLFAEPDAYFRSDYPSLSSKPKDGDASLRSPRQGKSRDGKRPRTSPAAGHKTWEGSRLRSWPAYQIEESRSPQAKEKPYVRPATALVHRNASLASPKSANWRPSSSSRRPRSPYEAFYGTSPPTLRALRRNLSDLLNKVDTLESREIQSKTSAIQQQARSVKLASQSTPVMSSAGMQRDEPESLGPGATKDVESGQLTVADPIIEADGVKDPSSESERRLDLHEEELDLLLHKFGLTSELPSFQPALMHPPGYIYTSGDRRKLSFVHESQAPGG